MKTLLRSLFSVGTTELTDEMLVNYWNFEGAGLTFDTPEDTAIWTYIKDFVAQHRHVPDSSTIKTHFERTKDIPVCDRIDILIPLTPKTRGDFLVYLEDRAEDRRVRLVGEMLKSAGEIVSRGITIKDGKKTTILKGPIDAVRYLAEQSHDVVTPTTGARLSGCVMDDGPDFLAEYERIKQDPLSGIGQFTGIQQMDEALQGAKRQELWIHAGFTGHLKSLLMLNWVYNQAVYFKHSSVVFTLEMPYPQVRAILYAIHSGHPKFSRIHAPLCYENLKDARLKPDEEEFLVKYIVPDFNSGAYGQIHFEVADPNKMDFTVQDMRMRAETLHGRSPFRTLFVDHALLVSPRRWVPSTTDRLNEVIRDCKKMALGFNRGAGMAVVLLFQISREGYKAAKKAREGGKLHVYDLTSLSYANEAERSADIVTASWVDPDLVKENKVLFVNPKTRDRKPFDPFFSSVHFPTRRITTLLDPAMSESVSAGVSMDDDIPESYGTGGGLSLEMIAP